MTNAQALSLRHQCCDNHNNWDSRQTDMNDGGESVEDIGARLKHFRQRMGYKSQKAFASAVGLTVSEVNHYESARRRLPLNAAIKIRRRFGISLDWLYSGDRLFLTAAMNRSLPPMGADGNEPGASQPA